jgi:ABC-type uncharacterized transport system substrate-binding protein
MPELAAGLVSSSVNVIATPGNMGAALAAKAATKTIPIVFAVPEDPNVAEVSTSLLLPVQSSTPRLKLP